MKTRLMSFAFGAVALALTGCTTAMYTKPSALGSMPDRYNFTIETGGFSGAGTADQRATQEIEKFMENNKYKRYEIVQRKDEFIPSGFKYIVQFYR